MSRTDKDRPYWVIMNDRTLGTVEHHQHAVPARRHYWSKIAERGERTLVEYGEPVWILRYRTGTPGMTIEEDAESRYSSLYFYDLATRTGQFIPRGGNKRWYFERRARYEWVGRTYKSLPEPPEGCTVDLPYTDWRRVPQGSCTTEPYSHNQPGMRWYDKALTDARVKDNRARRRRATQHMNGFVKEYNTYNDVDDSTWQDFQPRHSPLGGGYWG